MLRAALAHLWFVTIHPFDDGNGRIARAIADWQLARSENSAQRFYSMSAQIRHERNDYYDILERTQKGTLDITPWLEWFLGCLGRAFDGTETTLAAVLRKARFWERAARLTINERQRAVLNRLLDGFTGKLTTQKWATLAKCSHDTALRDIQGLIDRGLLKQGRRRRAQHELQSRPRIASLAELEPHVAAGQAMPHHLRQEPSAVAPRARICAGGTGNRCPTVKQAGREWRLFPG